MNKEENNKNIDFLYEVGSMRNLPRIWQQFIGTPVANNIEHSFRVMLLALMISRMEKQGNEEKIMKMALFHDLCETRSVDIAFFHREYVDRHEDLATKDQLRGTVFEGDIIELLKEYKERKSIESRIVKDADNIDIDVELKELINQGSGTAKRFADTQRPSVAEKLFTESGKKLWKQVQESDCNDWHVGPNLKFIKSDKFNK